MDLECETGKTDLTIAVRNAAGKIRSEAAGVNSVELLFSGNYAEGDCIEVTSSRYPLPLDIRFDETLPPAAVWLTGSRLVFPVPLGEQKCAYPPESFGEGIKRLSASVAGERSWNSYRNLSENPLDRRGKTTYYPHCTATVETRGESVFAARNTIDGVIEPSCHGNWPYQSWGDNEDPDASIMIEFGRSVSVDKVIINLRADFPHDSYWESARLEFSEGGGIDIKLKKTGDAQKFVFPVRKTSFVRLSKLVRSTENPSPFPALTQWAVFGKDGPD
jgi:hypothetical protein